MRRFTMVLVGLMLSGGMAARAAAQGTSIEGGMGLAGGTSEFQVGVRGTTARAGGIGLDVSVATYPDALSSSVLNLLSDVGVEYRARLGESATASVRAGGSFLLVASSGASGSAGGFNAGSGVILRLGARTAFRVDYTYRLFLSGGASASLSSVTFGVLIGH